MIYARWADPADDAVIKNFSLAMLEVLDRKSKARGLYYPFAFLNDAGLGQNPYAFYGKGKSLKKMKQISKRYDPTGVFQKLETGFKL